MSNNLEEKLREASCVGDIEAVTTLVSEGININSQNTTNGWTALHWAYKRGNEEIIRYLINHGADTNVKNYKGETPLEMCSASNTIEQDDMGHKVIPHYLKNPPLNGQVEIGNRLRSKHTDFTHMPTTSLPSSLNDELVLKVKVQGSNDPDYIEIEIPRWKLTYNNLVKICCEELGVLESQVERLRKLPDTRLRKDSDVKRLKEFQALEVVLKIPVSADKLNNRYQSISTCKDQTILY